MKTIKKTQHFIDWESSIKDSRTVAAVAARINRLAYGLAGDVKPAGQGISEIRIHHGKGYRIYFKQTAKELIILLCGGDKSSQNSDIKLAKKLAKELEE